MARVFGADEALLAVSEQPLRMFSLILIPVVVVSLLSEIYLVIGKGVLSSATQIGLILFILVPALTVSYLNPSYLWGSLPIGMWLLMFCCFGISYYLSRKDLTHWLYLTPLIGCVDSHAVSVNLRLG